MAKKGKKDKTAQFSFPYVIRTVKTCKKLLWTFGYANASQCLPMPTNTLAMLPAQTGLIRDGLGAKAGSEDGGGLVCLPLSRFPHLIYHRGQSLPTHLGCSIPKGTTGAKEEARAPIDKS